MGGDVESVETLREGSSKDVEIGGKKFGESETEFGESRMTRDKIGE